MKIKKIDIPLSLPKLINPRQYETFKGPFIALTVVGAAVCFGLFSSEQFFGQLDTSRTVVQIDKLLIELELMEAQLNNVRAQELNYFLAPDNNSAEEFTKSYTTLKTHLHDVKILQSGESSWPKDIDSTVNSIEEQIKYSRNLVDKHMSTKDMPAGNEKSEELDLIKSAHRAIANTIGSQTQLCQNYLERIQVSTIAALICIMLFRTAMIIVFFIALLLAHRYLFEKKRMETLLAGAETRFSALFETALDGIFTLDTDGRIETANAAMQKMFNLQANELIGQNITRIMPQFFSEDELQFGTNSVKSKEYKRTSPVSETTGVRKDGREIPIELSINTLKLDDRQVLSGIVRDITERKEAQQRMKDFYSTVSHELRTPLTSIRTALGLIEDGVTGTPTSETAPVIQIAQSEADRLIRMINDLLDIRKIEEGKFTLRLNDVSAKTLIETAMDAVGNLAKEGNVVLTSEVNSPSNTYCDSDRIVQVLTNLLSNAIKFSKPGDKVITSAEESDGKVIFAVTDFGAGIAEEQIAQLFGRFEQLESTNDRTKCGSGLGLFISKTIVEYHNGEIGVDISRKDRTRFWFELPISGRV
jgi:PAS domain S-box-containing protein